MWRNINRKLTASRTFPWLALLPALFPPIAAVAGCGGGLSQDDMRAYAIRRGSGADQVETPQGDQPENLDQETPKDEPRAAIPASTEATPQTEAGALPAEPPSPDADDAIESDKRPEETTRMTAAKVADSSSLNEQGETAATAPVSNSPHSHVPPTESQSEVVTAEINFEDAPPPSVPGAAERDAARRLFQETYGTEYVMAKTNPERLALAKRLFDKRLEVSADLPSSYVLLDIVRQIAVQVGNVDLALKANEELSQQFDLTGADLNTLRGLAKTVVDASSQMRLASAVEAQARILYRDEDYEQCVELLVLGIVASRQANDPASFQRLNWMRRQAEHAGLAKKRADQAFEALTATPEDPRSNEALGRYLCFVRLDWQNGLPILAKGSDSMLPALAGMDTECDSTAEQQLTVADGWWTASQQADLVERYAMRTRAAYWYERSLTHLGPGFARLKAEKRLAEVRGDGQPRDVEDN